MYAFVINIGIMEAECKQNLYQAILLTVESSRPLANVLTSCDRKVATSASNVLRVRILHDKAGSRCTIDYDDADQDDDELGM